MRGFRLVFMTCALLLAFVGCDSPDKVDDVCPTCNMRVADSKLHSTLLHLNGKTHSFDDIGCMILYAKKNQLDLSQTDAKVFTNDTLKFLDASSAYYTTDEDSPMGYGFGAYEKEKLNSIKFDEVIINMLRGEHMANPTLRKRTLGGKA